MLDVNNPTDLHVKYLSGVHRISPLYIEAGNLLECMTNKVEQYEMILNHFNQLSAFCQFVGAYFESYNSEPSSYTTAEDVMNSGVPHLNYAIINVNELYGTGYSSNSGEPLIVSLPKSVVQQGRQQRVSSRLE